VKNIYDQWTQTKCSGPANTKINTSSSEIFWYRSRACKFMRFN